jgi:hypothetical protein
VSALDPDEEFALSKALRRVGWIVGYENLGCIPEEAILVFIEVGLPIEDAPRLIAAYGHYIDDLLSIARGAVVRDAGRPERGET